MRDGSDAIADWPILNALLNTAAGATWVSVHHGGGVGIGNSIHAGMVVLADGTATTGERLERVLTTDPGTGVMRHADAGYPDALDAAREQGLDLPGAASRPRRPAEWAPCSSATWRRSLRRQAARRRYAGVRSATWKSSRRRTSSASTAVSRTSARCAAPEPGR